MAIILNDNIKINAGKPSESKYLNSSNVAYSATTEAISAVSISERYLGLTVLIDTGTTNVEYWWREGVTDLDLIEKKFASEQLVGDFVTGATNLGYFSGLTGLQWLNLSGGGFGTDAGLYYSEYNWYYADAGGIIKIGTPEHNGALRRAYVNALRTKSWIWDVATDAWIISQNDVIANVGNSIIGSTYTGSGYTNVDWNEGTDPYPKSYYNGSVLVTAYGSLYTGDTVTIGNPPFSYKGDQELNFRTIINETPEFLNIGFDDNYIRFSGVSSVISGQNIGAGTDVFTGQTGTVMGFRTLTQSGDTTITEAADGSLVIYSSSDGSANALTGATNTTGGTGFIYSGTTDRNIQLRSIIGSGNTIVTTVGENVIIDSTGGGGVFTEDITVSLDDGKTFGKYLDGETIPASGKTASEVIILACFEAKNPTVNLNGTGTNVVFGESGKTVNLTFSFSINTLNANVASTLLEYRRGSSGVWSTLTSDTGATNYTHIIDDSLNRFDTDIMYYRYTVVDSAGMTGIATDSVTPQSYQAPTITSALNGTVNTPELQTLREKGNTNSAPSGTIDSNRPNVNITDWTLERRYDAGAWTVLASGVGLSTQSVTIPNTSDTVIPSSVSSIDYRIVWEDEFSAGSGGAKLITFGYYNYAGNSINTSLSSSQIIALNNVAFATSASKTHNYTTAISEYAFYSYPATYSDVALITMLDNGVGTPITIYTSASGGAFQKLGDVIITNSYGESENYKIYRSNAPGAFSTDVVTFS